MSDVERTAGRAAKAYRPDARCMTMPRCTLSPSATSR